MKNIVLIVALLASTSCSTTKAAVTPALPDPTGSQPVGTTSVYLKDSSRPDPWVPSVKARELMISLWYPAKARGGRLQPYVTAQESALILKDQEVTGVPSDVLSRTRTHAYADAEPAGKRHSLPLVVLSPGFKMPRSSLTGLGEELASHGYMVAAVDHTYETLATTFPGGRVTECVACKSPKGKDFGARVAASRAADVSFVLDSLATSWRGASLIDQKRIAMAGHSVGGAAVLAAMVRDERVRVGIDLDGTTFATLPAGGLKRPFLFLGMQAKHEPGSGDPSWDRDWRLLTGWKRWLVVAGAEHGSFTDYAPISEAIGAEFAKLSGVRSAEITRRYVLAFFEQTLRGKAQPLLDQPSDPEVERRTP